MSKVVRLFCANLLLLILSACNLQAVSTHLPEQPAEPAQPPTAEILPTAYPSTPTADPMMIMPLVESPAIFTIHMLSELDGWGVTNAQIVRTNDGGMTWHNVTPPNVTTSGQSVATFILDNDHAWLQIPDPNNYPNGGSLYRTTNGGATWSSTTTPFSGGSLNFIDAENGWMLADLGIGAGSDAVAVFQTNDGGSTWNRTYTNDPNVSSAGDSLPLGGLKAGLTPLNMQTAWVYGVVYADGTAYLYRTDDSGANWKFVDSMPLPEGAANSQLSVSSLKFVDAQSAFMTINITSYDSYETNLAVYVSKDAGNTWSLMPTLIPKGGSADYLSAIEAVIYNGEQFYVTRDAAQTWSTVTPNVVFGENFASMDFVNVDTGWVITSDAANHRSLYRTIDGGATWSLLIQ